MANNTHLDALGKVIDEIRETISTAISSRSKAALAIAPLVNELFDSYDELRKTLAALSGQVQIILTDSGRVPAQRSRDAAAVVATSRASANSNLGVMRSAAEKIVKILVPMAMPPRPVMDAGRVAERSRLEIEWRMVLDAVPVDELFSRLERLLRDAVVAGDELAVWGLSSSGWVGLYLETRGVKLRVGQWNERSSELAAGVLGDDARAARELLETVDNARYNLATAVQYAEHFVRYGFDAVTVMAR